MDLPTCPACGQSVLDEDAVDCPFCGASMSGTPGKKPQKPSSAAKSSEKPAAKSAAKSEGPSDANSDDPFDVAVPVTRKVVALLPKPVKGRLHRVVCPMCETPGFTSKKAAGREVKCANSECLVPIFTAPAIEEEQPVAEEPTETESKGMGIGAYAMIAVVSAAMLGIGGWYFTGDPAPTGPPPDAPYVPPNGTPEVTGTNGGVGTDVTPPVKPVENSVPEVVNDPEPTAAELRTEALALMVDSSQDNNRNQQKPLCRRLTAEAFALTGDLKKVDEQIQQLEVVGPNLKFYRVLPLVEVAWHHLGSGNSSAASSVVDQIKPLIDDLPQFGTLGVDSAVEAATILVALDRNDEATRILSRFADTNTLGQLMASQALSRSALRCSFQQAVNLRPATGWENPQWVSVVYGVTSRGESDKALAWARQAASVFAVVDATSAWAEATLFAAGSTEPMTTIRTEISSMSPAQKAHVLARCSLVASILGDDAQAAAILTQAESALLKAGTPQAAKMPDLKRKLNAELPDATPLRHATLAATEIAHAYVALKKPDEAWKSVTVAMDFSRAIAPSPTIVSQPFKEIQQFGAGAVTSRLKQILNLLTDNEAANAYKEYRNRCQRFLDAANSRFAMQQKVLTSAAHWNMPEQVWQELKSRVGSISDPESAEPWYSTQVPSVVLAHFRVGNNKPLVNEVTEAVPNDKRSEDKTALMGLVIRQSVDKSEVTRAAGGLERFARDEKEERERRWQQETAIANGSYLASGGKSKDALAFAAAFQDVQVRTWLYEVIGEEIAVRGGTKAIMEAARNDDLTPPDKVAILRGMIAGLRESD